MKIFKKVALLFIIILLIFLVFLGLNINNKSDVTPQTTVQNTIIDRAGNEIQMPQKVEKIVSLAPSITETLIDLGLLDNIIAVDTNSLDIEGISTENIITFDMLNPDIEQIIALAPDIIFTTDMSQIDSSYSVLNDIIITCIPTSESVEAILEDIEFIGKITNKEDRAEQIITDYVNEMQSIINKIEESNLAKNQTVYFEISPLPSAYSFGQGTFLNDMLSKLFVQNIFEEFSGFISVSEEQIVAKNPDIIFTNATYIENPEEEIKARAQFQTINAVKNDRVYAIDANYSSRPNENSIFAFKQLAEALYPEIDF